MGFFDFMKKKKENINPEPKMPQGNAETQAGSPEDPFSNQSSFPSTPSAFSADSPNAQFSDPSQQMGPDQGGFDQGDFDPGMQQDIGPQMPPQDMGAPQQSYNYDNSSSREQEIILSKLDAIRTAIQNLDHRLSAIEDKLGNNRRNEEEKMF